MLDRVRTSLHSVITSSKGDGFVGLRVPRDLARRMNMMLGEPLCSETEMVRRRNARAKLASLRSGTATSSSPAPDAKPEAKLEAAPVMIYFEKDRGARLLARIQEMLDAKGIRYTLLDVAGDAVTKDFVMREAKCKEDELPVVFIAGAPVGGYNELVEWDVAGKLTKAIDPSST
ncbi:hypothetical protein AKJ09_09619 [Labilithrix luteola]|uniref:Uncharacterized protein n=1 Tax=Labilithrix luteola TaxID=1391654 RepID=A0A0K1QAZ1_9BACT|nr:hypothetical protein [Labilithrix luteola]AKV02956.1 hypothetical protein AKJ09_09619 [Labilithrix luteola]